MNIYETLLEQANKRSQAIAICDRRHGALRSTTYAQLVALVEQSAANLRNEHIQPGDTVLVLQGLSLELYVVLLALFKIGATALIVDPSLPKTTLQRCCEIASPVAVVAGGKGLLFTLLSAELRTIPRRLRVSRIVRPTAQHVAAGQNEPTFDAWPNTPALISFTSGSTGAPKAICRTHEFLLDQHTALKASLGLQPGSTQLVTLPVFVLANLASGVASVLPDANVSRPGNVDSDKIAAQLLTVFVTEVLASPAFFEQLCDYAQKHSKRFFGVKRIFTGGAPVFPSSYRKLKATFPEATIFGVYGSTEAEPIAKISLDAINNSDFAAMAEGGGLLAGYAAPGVELAIVNAAWQTSGKKIGRPEMLAHRLAVGEVGEILVTGKHVVKSYLNSECNAESKITIDADGALQTWHKTGDAGYIDGAGRLWLMGRVSAQIEDEFGILYPLACEAQVVEQTAIKRAAVVTRNSQRVIVVESKHRNAAGLLAEIAQRAHVERIVFVSELPVDARHNSKIDYRALDKLLDATG